MIFASFAEIISIGVILPFLGVLTSPEIIFSNPLAQPFINFFNFTNPKQLLFPLTISFVVSALFSGFMRLILLLGQTRLGHAIGADFSISIYRRTLYQPYSVHVSRNSSQVIAGISGKANSVVYNTIIPVLTILSSTLMLLFILLALVTIEPIIALSAFAGFSFIYLIVIFTTKKALARDAERVNYESNQVLKALQEGLGGIRDVLIDGTQATYCKIFRKADLQLRRASSNIVIISGSPRYGIEALSMVLIAVISYSLAVRASGITHTIPVLGALALGAQRLLPLLQQAYANWSMMRGGQAFLFDTLELLDQELPDYVEEKKIIPLEFKQKITLSNLDFRYPENTTWVLQKDFNLSIPKGGRIGFIGTTGSGKSTLLDIIMGLLQPTNGSMLIDDIEITAKNNRAWQAHIAHVPQTIFLADTTIAENIAFGVPLNQIDFVRVRQAAQKAQISSVIESWEKQYQTLVGERGIRLSGGQRQRIGIARAFYKKADVIIFDEATSALDNKTESAVIKAIESLGEDITLIIVAHRLTTLKNCTQIVELENGQIKRIGSYENIIGR